MIGDGIEIKNGVITVPASFSIDRTKLGEGSLGPSGQFVTEDSKFAPPNAKEIGDAIRAKFPQSDGSKQYLVESRKQLIDI